MVEILNSTQFYSKSVYSISSLYHGVYRGHKVLRSPKIETHLWFWSQMVINLVKAYLVTKRSQIESEIIEKVTNSDITCSR